MITGITHERYWQKGTWLHWSVKGFFFSAAGHWWENSCLLQKRKASPCRGIPVEIVIWKRNGSVNMSLSEPLGTVRPHWNAVRDVAGDLFGFLRRWGVIMRIPNSFEATVYVFACVAHAAHMTTHTWLCMGMCASVWSNVCKRDSFTRLLYTSPAVALGWQGFSSPLCCSSCGCHCLSP